LAAKGEDGGGSADKLPLAGGAIVANSSSDALRITQTGSGNALVVEDSTNPDSTPFVIDANGNVGIGTATPTEKLDVAGYIKASNLRINNPSGDSSIEVGGAGNVYIDLKTPNSDDYDLRIAAGETGNGIESINPLFINSTSNQPVYIASGGGNVGIGTATPTEKLDVAGGIRAASVQLNQSGNSFHAQVNPPSGLTSTQTFTLPNASGTIALTSEIPTDYEITSAQGRRLIASLKTVWPVNSNLAGILYFATTKVVAGTFTVRTTTGYARVIDHRGVLLTQVGTGSSTSDISLALPQANVGQRAYAVISVASGGSVRSGDITRLTTNSNEVTVIDVASTTALTYLLCYGNQLTELDVSANTALTILDCNTNQLTTLDVSTNTALTNLTCGTNQLTALGVSENTALITLSCGTNQLTALDVSTNTALTTLTCSNNLLPTAVVDQILVDLDALNVDGNGVYLGGTGNGAASATGIAAAVGLVAEGWTPVVYN
jgi:hypothetical protein